MKHPLQISEMLYAEYRTMTQRRVEESIVRQVILTKDFAMGSFDKLTDEEIQDQHKMCAR